MKTLLLPLLGVVALAQVPEKIKQGHSHLNDAFNAGPRAKPWVMDGIGKVNFPISTKNPEVQKWFNQGVAHAHNFWWFEAERSFRWARKLDPDHPMPYWGLALSSQDGKRGEEFMKEARKRMSRADERERLWIEAYSAMFIDDPLRKPEKDGGTRFREAMESLIVRFPNDIEAKSFLGLSMMGEQRMGAEKLFQEVIAADPNHPGAHHYRIHNWNYHEAAFALDSCRKYGAIAFDTGHALHMPGHIYSVLGMWHEAAIAMDAATRSEARYMRERLIMPYNAWNYPHNKNYLCHIQEQLGLASQSLDGARQLLEAAPSDSKDNYLHGQGMAAFVRNHVKFERWKEYLEALDSLPSPDAFIPKTLKLYGETRAHIALGNLDKALASYKKHEELKSEADKTKWWKPAYEAQGKELKGRMLLARGDTLEGLALMQQAAQEQFGGKIPGETEILYHPDIAWSGLGYAYLEAKSPALAIPAFERSLGFTRNDGFAIAGLVRAHHYIGETEKARERLSQLLYVWSNADKGLKPLELALSTGIKAEPKLATAAPERNYARETLAKFGPNRWENYPAPKLDAVDVESKRVTLEEYKGKNVLLVFYLGDECPHCLEQLRSINKRKAEFEAEDTVVLAISKDTPAENKESLKMGEVKFRLLSDVGLENAKRFASYDDFEEIELHSSILVNRDGRVVWARNGGDPFTDLDFLLKEIRRSNAAAANRR